MKFVCFIASTMLILLINQHSTMGLPVSEPLVEQRCTGEGEYEENGICKKVSQTMTVTEITRVGKRIPDRKDGSCPEGMIHGKHGICQEIELTETTTVRKEELDRKETELTETTTVRKEELGGKKIQLPVIKPVLNEESDLKSGACPEGMVHGKHGSCKEIGLIETTTVRKEELDRKDMELTETTTVRKEELDRKDMELTETTTVHKEELDRKVNLNNCPMGTKKDEQGACQLIEPTDNKNKTTDPKAFLGKDGSCPKYFEMVNNTCLYIKPKPTLPAYPVLPNGAVPKIGNVESVEYEKVPMNSDGSCPEGTEYSEYRSCQRPITASKSKFDIKADGKCPADFELIDGKCRPKSSKEQDQSSEATTTGALPLPSESTTSAAEPKINRKSEIETATIKESSAELLATSTSQPL